MDPVAELLQANHRPATARKLYGVDHETVIDGRSEQAEVVRQVRVFAD